MFHNTPDSILGHPAPNVQHRVQGIIVVYDQVGLLAGPALLQVQALARYVALPVALAHRSRAAKQCRVAFDRPAERDLECRLDPDLQVPAALQLGAEEKDTVEQEDRAKPGRLDGRG